MRNLILAAAIAALSTTASANSLTDWLSLSPSQQVACCSSSSSQTWVRARVWDTRSQRWVSRYVRPVPGRYSTGADSTDCCEMPTHGDD